MSTKPDSSFFTSDELGFFADMLFKCNILAEFNPTKAMHLYENVTMSQITESFTLKGAHNYIPD